MSQVTVDLAPIGREDLKQMREWRNDWRIMDWTRQSDFVDDIHHEAWFESQSKDPTTRMYKVMCRTNGTTSFVGVCGLTSIDWRNRRAEFSLYIGPAFHRKGLGNMALRVLLNHGFKNLGLNVIWGETMDGNPAASMFEKVGLTKEGTRRQFYFKNGKLLDAHLYSVTAEEWHARSRRLPDSGDNSIADGDGGVKSAASADPIPPTPIRRKKRAGAQAAVIDAEVVGRDSGAPKEGADRRE